MADPHDLPGIQLDQVIRNVLLPIEM